MRAFWVTILILTMVSCLKEGCAQSTTVLKEFSFSSPALPGQTLHGLIYSPKTKEQKMPLLIYIHGNDSKGSNLDLVRKKGLPKVLAAGTPLPMMIIAPQLPIDQDWSPAFIDLFLNYINSRYSIDQDRIYLTGVSVGGASAIDYTIANPDKIAAVICVSGWGNPHEVCKMKNVPAWFFHAIDDDRVSPVGSRVLTESLYVCGGDARLTEFPEGNHDIADKVYTYPLLFDWLLSRKKNLDPHSQSRIQLNSNTIGYRMAKALSNVSGIWASPGGEFYGINGKNSSPVLVNFDSTSRVRKMHIIQHAANFSWQDLCASADTLFIADVGNENFKREFFQIYKISIQDLANEKISATKIEFTIAKGPNLNFKSSFYLNENIYLFGESFEKDVYLVEVPVREGSKTEAHLVANCTKLMNESITSAHYDPTQKTLFLLTKNNLGIVSLADGIQSLSTKNAVHIQLPNNTQKEALTMLPNGYLAFADKFFLGTFDGNLYLFKYP